MVISATAPSPDSGKRGRVSTLPLALACFIIFLIEARNWTWSSVQSISNFMLSCTTDIPSLGQH
ncbi:hypothetical protein ES705_37093 [subsurface metagenome]